MYLSLQIHFLIFGYITNDTYSKETDRIVSLAIDETTKTFEKHKEELQGTIKSEGKLPPKFLTRFIPDVLCQLASLNSQQNQWKKIADGY